MTEFNNQQNFANQVMPMQNVVSKPPRRKAKIFSLISLIVMYALVTACAGLSAEIASTYYGDISYLPVFSIILMLMFIPITIIFFVKNREFNVALVVLNSIVIALCITLIVLSVVAYENAAFYTRYWSTYYREYRYSYEYCVADECWGVLGIACTMLVLSVLTLIFNIVANVKARKNAVRPQASNAENVRVQAPVINVQSAPIAQPTASIAPQSAPIAPVEQNVSGIEKELTDVKRMYDNNIISEEEYNKIRAAIIARYYK